MNPYTYKIRFLFIHPDMDFSAIRDLFSSIAGINTAHVSTAGQERHSHKGERLEGKYFDSRWGFDFETKKEWNHSEEKSSAVAIDEMLTKILPHKQKLFELHESGCNMQVIIAIGVNENTSEGFPPELLCKLADIKLNLWVDIYPPDEKAV